MSTSGQEEVVALYTELATNPAKDYGWGTGLANSLQYGYRDAWVARLPPAVFEGAAAGGCPFELGPIAEGSTVLDIGCGVGADVCIAANMVGPRGRVYGVDITPAMVAKAREYADASGVSDRVTILQGSPHWPQLTGGTHEGVTWPMLIPPGSVDTVISNNAINLMDRKP
mmetsp:Transcript_131329/g.227320  ORF Transcript_131329/g.227320 Transcript_131329/m.227320 type:complete len:170 (-) Transcript_131329:1130-1639(-)